MFSLQLYRGSVWNKQESVDNLNIYEKDALDQLPKKKKGGTEGLIWAD